MTVKRIVTPNRWIGGTGEQPTEATIPRVRVGDTFYDKDTGLWYITYDGTTWAAKKEPTANDIVEVRVAKAIDASIGAYTAGDMVNDDDCCTVAAPWTLAGAANVTGGYGAIWGVRLFNETPNLAVQHEILLFNAAPVGSGVIEFTDNTPNVHPHKADMAKYIDSILMPTSIARGAAVATYTKASPSTTGNLPLFYKCATGSTSLSFVLVTRTAYTQTETYDIEIRFSLERF